MLATCQYETVQGVRDGVAVVAAGDPVGTLANLCPAVAHRDPQAGHAQHFDIVLLVAKGNHFLARDAMLGDPSIKTLALAIAGM